MPFAHPDSSLPLAQHRRFSEQHGDEDAKGFADETADETGPAHREQEHAQQARAQDATLAADCHLLALVAHHSDAKRG